MYSLFFSLFIVGPGWFVFFSLFIDYAKQLFSITFIVGHRATAGTGYCKRSVSSLLISQYQLQVFRVTAAASVLCVNINFWAHNTCTHVGIGIRVCVCNCNVNCWAHENVYTYTHVTYEHIATTDLCRASPNLLFQYFLLIPS